MLIGGTILGLLYLQYILMKSEDRAFHLILIGITAYAAMQVNEFTKS